MVIFGQDILDLFKSKKTVFFDLHFSPSTKQNQGTFAITAKLIFKEL